jgi:hypothetical protein
MYNQFAGRQAVGIKSILSTFIQAMGSISFAPQQVQAVEQVAVIRGSYQLANAVMNQLWTLLWTGTIRQDTTHNATQCIGQQRATTDFSM